MYFTWLKRMEVVAGVHDCMRKVFSLMVSFAPVGSPVFWSMAGIYRNTHTTYYIYMHALLLLSVALCH